MKHRWWCDSSSACQHQPFCPHLSLPGPVSVCWAPPQFATSSPAGPPPYPLPLVCHHQPCRAASGCGDEWSEAELFHRNAKLGQLGLVGADDVVVRLTHACEL
eukprot:scaffold15196_cov121-Isochrysis_galbana.AAC.1